MTGFVFQEPDGQAVAATVEDEIAFSMEQLGVAPDDHAQAGRGDAGSARRRALRNRARAPRSPGGERQRVAIAAAMALHPALLVLDEPTSQLDPWGADDVMTALERLNADLSVTIVIAEHRLERLLPLMDYADLDRGRTDWQREGALDEIAPSPAGCPRSRRWSALARNDSVLEPIPRTSRSQAHTDGWIHAVRAADPPTMPSVRPSDQRPRHASSH